MPLRYGVSAATVPNLCLECGDSCRRPKRFCDDTHREMFGRGTRIDQRGAAQVAAARAQLGITAESLQCHLKLDLTGKFVKLVDVCFIDGTEHQDGKPVIQGA